MLIVFSFLSAFFLVPMVSGQQGRPIPPGIREAEKQSNKPLDPAMAAMPSAPDPAKLKQEADELAQLSAGVPSDLARVARGQLPKGPGRQTQAYRETRQAIAQPTDPIALATNRSSLLDCGRRWRPMSTKQAYATRARQPKLQSRIQNVLNSYELHMPVT